MTKTGIKINYGNFEHIEDTWDGTTYYPSSWILIYALTSGGTCITRHETVNLDPKHIYILPPGLVFTGNQKNNPKLFYLHFDAVHIFERAKPSIYRVAIDTFFRELLDRIFKEVLPAPHFLAEAGMMYAVALASSALAHVPHDSLIEEPKDPRIEEAIECLRTDLKHSRKMEDIAEQCGLSSSAFTRIFKKETGFTPYHYLTDLRIEWACEILDRDATPIERIAEMIGFNDRFHFSKVFKSKVGITPVEYRRRRS